MIRTYYYFISFEIRESVNIYFSILPDTRFYKVRVSLNGVDKYELAIEVVFDGFKYK